MQPYVSALRCLLCLVMAVSAYLLLYIFVATNGELWVDRSVLVVKKASLYLFVSAFALGWVDKSKRLLVGGALALLAWYLGPVPGQVACMFGGLSGGSDRYSNCGLDITFFPAGAMYLAALIFHQRATKILLLFSCLVLPVGSVVTYLHLVIPLVQEISSIEPHTECVLRQSHHDPYAFDASSLSRIRKGGDLNVGWIISEQSPRFYKVSDGETFIWKYSQRTFKRAKTINKLVEFCNREQPLGMSLANTQNVYHQMRGKRRAIFRQRALPHGKSVLERKKAAQLAARR